MVDQRCAGGVVALHVQHRERAVTLGEQLILLQLRVQEIDAVQLHPGKFPGGNLHPALLCARIHDAERLKLRVVRSLWQKQQRRAQRTRHQKEDPVAVFFAYHLCDLLRKECPAEQCGRAWNYA